MFERINDSINSIIYELVKGLVEPVFMVVDFLLRIFATEGMLRDLLSYAWVNQLIIGGQAIAGAVLACRLTWEALQMATLRSEGAPTDPGGLLKRTVMSAIAIAGGPWVVKQAIVVANMFALWVASIGVGFGFDNLNSSEVVDNAISTILIGIGGTAGAGVVVALGPIAWAVATAVIGIFLFLILIQAAIRTIEITFLAIISPFAALGHMSGGGLADVWVREVIILVVTHALQIITLSLAIVLLIGVNVGGGISVAARPFFGLAGLWVAFRTPKIIKNYAYHSGVGGAVGTVSQSAVYRLVSTLGRR